MTRPIDIDVDPLRGRLYWAELGPDVIGEPLQPSGKVWTAQLDGSDPKLIAENLYQPIDVVVDIARESIYWSEGIEGRLWRADLDGENASIVANLPFGLYHNLALDAPPIVPEPAAMPIALSLGLCILRRRRLGS
jgi:hypothetical protein